MVERVVSATRGVDAQPPQLVPPRDRRLAVLERADRLPAVEPGVADGHGLLLGDARGEQPADAPRFRVRARPSIQAGRPDLWPAWRPGLWRGLCALARQASIAWPKPVNFHSPCSCLSVTCLSSVATGVALVSALA